MFSVWYRVRKTYEKPNDGFLAIGSRYPGVVSDDGLIGGVTSVVIARETIPGTATGSGWIAAGPLVGIVGFLALLGSLTGGDVTGAMLAVVRRIVGALNGAISA